MQPSRSLLNSIALLSISMVVCPLDSWAQTGAVRPRVMHPVDVQDRVTLRGNVHPLARREFDQGLAPDNLPMKRMLLVLQRGTDQEAALRQLLDEQQVKSSPFFHQWLTPEQFGQQFGPADSDFQAVTDWLATQGFEVTKVSAGRTIIEFSGTAGLVRQVLGTEIHQFHVNGEDHWANTSDPQIPAALAPVVAGFASLNNFRRKPLSHNLGTFSRSKLTGEVQPLFTFSPQPNGYLFALGPADFATIYNVAPLWSAETDGSGQTVAVVGETNINIQDVRDFRSMFGLPAKDPNIILTGPDPGIVGDETEADLDVEWSGAVAKGATIDLVVSETTEATPGVDLSALYIVDNNLAPVMSISYGPCEADLGASGNLFHSTLWEQAAAQGITVLVAAGDSGSATCDYGVSPAMVAITGFSVNGLASTPFNVAVGGTDFDDANNPWAYWNQTNTFGTQSSAKSYIPESTWNDSCARSGLLTACANAASDRGFQYFIDLIAGGGGPSNCINSTGTYPNFTCSGGYAKPSWQTASGVPNDGARDVPDVSLFAGGGRNFSFYVFCEMDANASSGGNANSCDVNASYTDFQGAGGTSISVQVFAGIMALVNQAHGRQGNANYVLYPLAAQNPSSCNSSATAVTNSSCIFYDVTTGNNSVACAGGSPQCSNTVSGQYGILVSGSTSTPAWNATAGYDLATGLGSVNVANLVNNWKSHFTLSTTTLLLSTNPATNPITLTHGQPINFTVNVTAGSGTPGGDVSLIAQTGSSTSSLTGIGPFTLNGGSVSSSTDMLPGGTYNVTAHYAGNGTFGASDSSPGIPVTVSKESSQTKVGLVTFDLTTGAPSYAATSAVYGSPYVLRMDVTNSSGQLCAPLSASGQQFSPAYPCPTGALTVTPAPTDTNPPPGTVPGSYTLNSQGYAEDVPIQQSPGLYNFVASYAGDNSYQPSASSPVAVTISKAPTKTTLSGLPSGVVGGVSSYSCCTIRVDTQSNGLAPSLAVQYLINGSTVQGIGGDVNWSNGSPSGFAWSQLLGTPPILPVGTSTVVAQFLGDPNYAASSSPSVSVTVTDFSVSVSPTSLSIPAPGQSGTAVLTVTPLAGFTGALNLNCYAGTVPGLSCAFSPTSVTITGSSPATSTLTVTTVGPSSLTPIVLQQRLRPNPALAAEWLWYAFGLTSLGLLMSLFVARRRSAARLLVIGLFVLGAWISCGGSGGGGGGSLPPAAPSVNFSPSRIVFGSQVTGSSSAFLSTLMSNTGNATLSISGATINGANGGDFTQTNDCLSTLPAGANCTFDVTFKPTAAGSRSASLAVTDNAADSPQTVSLSGTGLAPATAINLSPTTLAFGEVGAGMTSAAEIVTLANTGAGALSISSIAVGNTNPPYQTSFTQTNNCGNTLAAGTNCTIRVTFAPPGTGSYSGNLLFNDNAIASPQIVSMTGMGVTPPGTYAISVGATSGNDTHAVPLNVTVTLR